MNVTLRGKRQHHRTVSFDALSNSVVLIEHHIELLRCVDWLIDLGPEGGSGGGLVIAEGTPEADAST